MIRDCRPVPRVSEVARAMAIHMSTASNLVDRLGRHGLVRLCLTDTGRSPAPLEPLPGTL